MDCYRALPPVVTIVTSDSSVNSKRLLVSDDKTDGIQPACKTRSACLPGRRLFILNARYYLLSIASECAVARAEVIWDLTKPFEYANLYMQFATASFRGRREVRSGLSKSGFGDAPILDSHCLSLAIFPVGGAAKGTRSAPFPGELRVSGSLRAGRSEFGRAAPGWECDLEIAKAPTEIKELNPSNSLGTADLDSLELRLLLQEG